MAEEERNPTLLRFAASEGQVGDWAMYCGPASWSYLEVLGGGQKLSATTAREIAFLFASGAATGKEDPIWSKYLKLHYRD